MKRVIVLGGKGRFGRTIVEQLAQHGISAAVASRRSGADFCIDADNRASIQAAVRAGDLVIDAAGPFYSRSMALIESAMEIGFDVIDINDDLSYAERVLAAKERIDAAGIRVLSSASTVSAIAAAAIRQAGILSPVRMSGIIAPASRYTANVGTARSLLRSVGQPIQIWRDGRLQSALGWTDPRRFQLPPPIGRLEGRLFESADAVFLPRIWPSLSDVTMHVDANTPGVNTMLRVAARSPVARRFLASQARLGARFAKWLGKSAGGVGYEMEDNQGRIVRYAIVAAENSYLAAVAPVVLAVDAMWHNRFPHRGLVLPDRHVNPSKLAEYLERVGLSWRRFD